MNLDDLDGDGIPDGAAVSLKREQVDADTGERDVLQANWRKKSGEPEARRPMMDVPESAQPVPADKQMGGTPPADPANPWDAFAARTDRAADRAGIFRTNTVNRPVMEGDRRSHLESTRDNGALRPELRENARRSIAVMDANTGRREDLASAERRTFVTATGQAEAGQAKAEGVLEGKQVMADAMRDQAATGAQGRATTQELKNEGQARVESERTRRAQVTQELKNSGQLAAANAYALAGRDRAELSAETDRYVAELQKQGKVEAAQILAKAKGKIDPMVFFEATPEQRDLLIKSMTKGGDDNPYSPAAMMESSRTQDEQVLIEAPDGTRRMVAKGSAQKYVEKGGKIVER